MPVWWVTGASGFLGRHVLGQLTIWDEMVAELGEDARSRIVAIGRRSTSTPITIDRVETASVGFDDPYSIQDLAHRVPPDFVIHCAGRTLPASEDELRRANLDATVNLFAGLRRLAKPVRVVLAGSAAELGPVGAGELPVGEDHPCRPIEPYGRIKWEAGRAALAEQLPLEAIVARIFNPIGPGLPESQAFGQFVRRLLEPAADPLTLRVGHLDARRDFVDVRDVARAMIALALQGVPRTVYHVGTGRSHRIGDGLNELIRLSGRAVRLEIDPTLGNPQGPPDSRADIGRIQVETDWEPRISWEKSLADLWNDAKTRASRDNDAAASSRA
jgi:GDP-4-dehydro-6-deoxy-D-mannose reductase